MAVDLLEARNNSDLARRVDEGAQRRFGVVAGSMAVEGPGPTPFGWRPLPPGLIDMLLGAARPGAHGSVRRRRRAVRRGGRRRSAARAVVRMAIWTPAPQRGVLAFGSADPEGFTPDMGAELVAFLARVVERTAERWPAL